MIPKIIVLTGTDNPSEVIDRYAAANSISPLYRIIVEPEKTELTVEQIHLFQKDIQVSFSHPFLVVLKGVDASSNEVQNALLKSLEEESGRIHFLLLVHNPALLLPTIRSRCAVVDGKSEARTYSQKIDPQELFSFSHNSDSTKESALQKIDEYVSSNSFSSIPLLRHTLTMRKLIVDNNVNPVMALDNILIFLHKASTMKKTHEK